MLAHTQRRDGGIGHARAPVFQQLQATTTVIEAPDDALALPAAQMGASVQAIEAGERRERTALRRAQETIPDAFGAALAGAPLRPFRGDATFRRRSP